MSDPDFIGETNETSSVSGTGILADCGADSDESDMWSCNKLLFEALGLRENHAQVALFSRHLTDSPNQYLWGLQLKRGLALTEPRFKLARSLNYLNSLCLSAPGSQPCPHRFPRQVRAALHHLGLMNYFLGEHFVSVSA